ncbi:TPA: A24 family peptidase [Photobacterium damselae]
MGDLSMKWWFLLTAISFYICIQDIRLRKISNKSCVVVGSICLILSINQANYSIIPYTITIFIFGFILFLFRIIAAGDIKLISAFSIAIDPQYILLTLICVLFLGGLVAFFQIIWLRVTRKSLNDSLGVPYGIPICIGCLLGIAASI